MSRSRYLEDQPSPEAVELYRRARALIEAGHATGDSSPGTPHREFLEAMRQLGRELGLSFGARSPVDCGDRPPAHLVFNPVQMEAWRTAYAWRRRIEAVMAN